MRSQYVGVSASLLLFVALVAPDVMCPDRRQRVLPLMFARPLTGVDYVIAKVGAIASMAAFLMATQATAQGPVVAIAIVGWLVGLAAPDLLASPAGFEPALPP